MRPIFVIFALLAASPSWAALIDFEEFTPGFGYSYLESNGFSISGDTFSIIDVNTNFLGDFPNAITIETLSGANFDIEALDIFQYAGKSLLLIGYYTGGATVQTKIVTAVTGSITVNLDSSWKNLESFQVQLTIDSGNTGLDNIVVNAVPIPPAIWLFGSALAGLGWLRRNQSV